MNFTLEEYIGARFRILEDLGDVLEEGMIVEGISVSEDKLNVVIVDDGCEDYLLFNEIRDGQVELLYQNEKIDFNSDSLDSLL